MQVPVKDCRYLREVKNRIRYCRSLFVIGLNDDCEAFSISGNKSGQMRHQYQCRERSVVCDFQSAQQ